MLTSATIEEANGSVATVTATVATGVETPFTIEVAFTPIAPATADDYTLSENRTLSFAANATESTGTVALTAVDNEAVAPDKAVTVSGTVSDPVAATPGALTLTITDSEPPVAPANVRAMARDASVLLSWDAPLPGAEVTGHEYRYKAGTETDYPDSWTAIPASATGGSNAGEYMVADLANGTMYTFQVRAVNAFGESAPGDDAPNATPTSMPRLTLALTPVKIVEQVDAGASDEDESTANVKATLSRAVSTAFTVEVAVAPVSPAIAGDYTLSGNTTLSFAANALVSTGTVTITAVDNDAAQPDKTVRVSGSTANTDVMAPGPAMLTIANDDNWAPTSSDGRIETVEDTAYVFGPADFSFADEDGQSLANVRVVTLPRAGALELNGGAVAAGDTVAAADLADLAFEPAPNGNGSPYATFTFRVGDGEAESAAAYTMTVDVTAVNDAPAFVGAAALSMAENGTAAGTVGAKDPDTGDTVRYALTGGADASKFAIDAATGALTFRSAPDYETPTDAASTEPANDAGDNEYVVIVTATSGTGSRALTASRTVLVTVTDMGETQPGERSVSEVAFTSSPGDDGLYGIDDLVTVTVTFSGPVTVEPTPVVEMGGVARQAACYAAGSGTDTLTFRHAVREGSSGSPTLVSLHSNGPVFQDTGKIYAGSADHPANLDFVATEADDEHVFDGRRPTLRSSDLSADRQRILLRFSEDLSSTTAPASAFRVTVADGEAEVSAATAADRTVTLTLAEAAGAGERVEVAYREPTPVDRTPPEGEDLSRDDTCGLDFADDDTHAIQDLAGNDARAFDVVVAYPSAVLAGAFQNLLEAHDGETPFTFRIAFSEALGSSYKALRDTALQVSNGSITNVHRVDGRNDLWSVTVAPANDNAVALSMPIPDSCADLKKAICTPDRRGLGLAVEATVPGPGSGLTASFGAMPAQHDGETAFTFRILFSEPVEIEAESMRDDAVEATQDGESLEATGARKVDERKDLWEITVQPASSADLAIGVGPTGACSESGAICTEGGLALSSTLQATVTGPPSLSVADATVREGPDATLDFEVSLSRQEAGTVTVDYATADGTATAAVDYRAASGTLTFNPGELAKTVSVAVLIDSHDEGSETLRLKLSNASGAPLLRDKATGTIENTGAMPAAWLVRFGRMVAGQAMEAVAARLDGGGGSHVEVGGIRLEFSGGALGAERAEDGETLLEALSGAGPEEPGAQPRRMTERELLLGSSFQLAAGGEDGGPALTAWGRFATGGFDGDADGLRMDGSVTSSFVGADYADERWLAGLALGMSEGEGDFAMAEGNQTGRLESSLAAVYPYARLGLGEKVELWGLAGYGAGTLTQTLRMDGDNETRIETDIALRMGAVGARGELLSPAEPSGLALAVESDAFWVRTTSEAVHGSAGGNLEASEADATRLRLALEGSRSFETGGGRLTPSLEVALRQDGGDAETGTGVEVGAAIRYASGGITVEGSVRGLVAHEENGYEEWGASGSVRVDPDTSGRGLSFTVAPAWGAASSGVERLWSLADARGLAPDDGAEPGRRIETEFGYGLDLRHLPGVFVPYAGLALGEGGERRWRTGLRWRVVPEATFGLEAARSERSGADNTPADSVMLRGSLRW